MTAPPFLHDEHGPVAFYGLPYLEPGLVHTHLGAEKPSHHAVLSAAMDKVRTDLAARPANTRSVVLAHAFVTGADTSDSERDITAGGVPSVSASVFTGVDYVALGHLHRCQQISERIRYSGSPLAYSFSEADYPKATWLIDLDANSDLTARKILCPVPRRLRQLTGTLNDLLTQPEHADYEDCWLHITLTDTDRPHMAMERLRERFPHALKLSFSHQRDTDTQSYRSRVNGRSDCCGSVRGEQARFSGLGIAHFGERIPFAGTRRMDLPLAIDEIARRSAGLRFPGCSWVGAVLLTGSGCCAAPPSRRCNGRMSMVQRDCFCRLQAVGDTV
ncbi:exonuclease SbcCD subunit D [[Kitasatospora] papulosa]|uniref:exonuclease SbcCD subunit D n=1 Tax=[Kitasatospora] papulosa TaxID=1464011 RepID=UPI00368212EC